MSEEIKFDHFKNINELLEHIDLWYRVDDIEYTRWFGLEDLYNLKIYITSLQQKVEQLETIRKEAIKYVQEKADYPISYYHLLNDLLNILNKGE